MKEKTKRIIETIIGVIVMDAFFLMIAIIVIKELLERY